MNVYWCNIVCFYMRWSLFIQGNAKVCWFNITSHIVYEFKILIFLHIQMFTFKANNSSIVKLGFKSSYLDKHHFGHNVVTTRFQPHANTLDTIPKLFAMHWCVEIITWGSSWVYTWQHPIQYHLMKYASWLCIKHYHKWSIDHMYSCNNWMKIFFLLHLSPFALFLTLNYGTTLRA